MICAEVRESRPAGQERNGPPTGDLSRSDSSLLPENVAAIEETMRWNRAAGRFAVFPRSGAFRFHRLGHGEGEQQRRHERAQSENDKADAVALAFCDPGKRRGTDECANLVDEPPEAEKAPAARRGSHVGAEHL